MATKDKTTRNQAQNQQTGSGTVMTQFGEVIVIQTHATPSNQEIGNLMRVMAKINKNRSYS